MDARAAWRRLGAWQWAASYLAIVLLAALVGALGVGFGNALFVAGALAILAAAGFVGTGGETRFRIVRNLFGQPVAVEPHDLQKRHWQISTGMKVFLLGLALWAPLVYLAARG